MHQPLAGEVGRGVDRQHTGLLQRNARWVAVVIYDDLPKDEAHGWKFLTIGPDNKLTDFRVKTITRNATKEAQLTQINEQNLGSRIIFLCGYLHQGID